MEKKKLTTGLYVLLFLICCGLSPTLLQATDYEWKNDGTAAWSPTLPTTFESSDVIVIKCTDAWTIPSSVTSGSVKIKVDNIASGTVTWSASNVTISEIEIVASTSVASLTLPTVTSVGNVIVTSGSSTVASLTLSAATSVGNITVTGATAGTFTASSATSVGNITTSGVNHTLTLNSNAMTLGNIDLGGAQKLTIAKTPSNTISNVKVSGTGELTFTEIANITTLEVSTGAKATFTAGANVTTFLPADAKQRGTIEGQKITLDANKTASVLLAAATPKLTSVDTLDLSTFKFTVDVPLNIYNITIPATGIVEDLNGIMKINGEIKSSDILGAFVGLLIHKTSTSGSGWYYAGNYLGNTGNSINGLINGTLTINDGTPANALQGASFVTAPIVYYTGSAATLDVPKTVTTLGKIYANTAGNHRLIANGDLTTGAINVSNSANLTLKNTQGASGAKYTVNAGSPSIIVDNAILNIDTTSSNLVDALIVVNGGILNYRLGNYTNLLEVRGATYLGADVNGIPGTINIIGTGRATGSPSSTASVSFIGIVDMSTGYNVSAGTVNTATNGDLYGNLTITNAAAYFMDNLNNTTAVTSGTGKLDLTGTEAHFEGIATFIGLLGENIITDENTSLIFSGAQVSFPKTPATGRNLFNLIFNSTLSNNEPIYGNITMSGNFIANTANGIINIGKSGTPTTITVNGEVGFGSIAHIYTTAAGSELSLIYNGKITGFGGTNYSSSIDLTIGGTAQSVVTLPAIITALRNLTIDRANAVVMPGANLTVSGDLNVNNGMLKTFNVSDFALTVTGNTTIGMGGVLDLSLGASTAIAITHSLGSSETNTITNNGQIKFNGYTTTPTINTLTMNGVYSNATGSMTANNQSSLIINAKADLNLPASLTELNSLTYNIGTYTLTLNPGTDLITNKLVNTLGTLSLGGNTLKVLDGSAIVTTGFININNGSTFDITNSANVTLAYLVATDETASLILRGDKTYVPATGILTKIKNLTLIDVGTSTFTLTDNLEVFGNLNIVAAVTVSKLIVGPLDLTVYGDINLTSNANVATLDLSSSTLFAHGQLNANTSSVVTTSAKTIFNILGNGKQFQFPPNSTLLLGKLSLDRPAGAKFNNIISSTAPLITLGETSVTNNEPVLELVNGMLDLNGSNLTFVTADNTISETPNAYVTNTGTSQFAADITNNATYGAIYSVVNANLPQINSIGVNDIALTDVTTTTAGAVRRYPKSVTIPNLGRSVKRYYYLNVANNHLDNVTFTYFKNEAVGTEATMKVYLENLGAVGSTTDAFSNSEELKGNTQVTPSTDFTTGNVMVSKFTDGKSYTVTGGMLGIGGYLFTFASRPSGGSMKVWTNGTGDSQWQTAGNWGPTPGAPGVLDQAIIARATDNIYISGLATCGDLFMDGDDITLFGSVPSSSNKPVLQVTGNINIEGASAIKGVDGTNRLDLRVGDGQLQGVSTSVSARYMGDDETTGAWFDNVEINMATLLPSDGMRVSGNITLNGNSTIQQEAGEQLVLYGPNSTAKSLSMSISSAAVFGDIVLDNSANMTTTADFQLKGAFIFMDATSKWISTAGRITATESNQLLWNNPSNAQFEVFNMDIGSTANVTDKSEPLGNITFRGTLNKIGVSTLVPYKTNYTVGANGEYAVIFNSTSQTEIMNGAEGALLFHNLIVRPGTKLRTSSSFNIQNYLEVGENAEMLCESGTVTYDGTDIMRIVNVSDRTLVHNDMLIKGRVRTASSWKLAGNMFVDKSPAYNYFEATAGTITILNGGQTKRLIDSATSDGSVVLLYPSITFNKLYIADNSILATGAAGSTSKTDGSFVIKNRGENNGMASGIEVAPTGQFLQTANGTVHFQTDNMIQDTSSKWIINGNTSNKMQFGNIYVEAGNAKNYVKTRSSFEVLGSKSNATNTGSQTSQFLIAGGGADFEAIEGTIHFVAAIDTALLSAIAPSNAQFANLRSANGVVLQINDADEIFVSGDLIADGTSKFVAGAPATATSKVTLNGKNAPQHLIGNTTQSPTFTFTSLRIDKGNNLPFNYVDNPYADSTGVVLMQKPTLIAKGITSDASELILNNGVLNLGIDTLTVQANYITRHNGAIDGANGTYVINDGHQALYLEDPLFNVGSKPTLYNLIVNAEHQLRNDLTVNGNLILKSGKLTLAPVGVADIVEPKLLTLYGDLIQENVNSVLASGTTTDNTFTRLVLKGKGTVIGGLRNELFGSTNPTAFSITVQRGETLGGPLTMDIAKGANLTIQTGVNTLALAGNTLTLSDVNTAANPVGVTIISGNITADDASTVDFRSLDVIPANIFAKSSAGTIVLGGGSGHPTEVQIRGNVQINKELRLVHPGSNDELKIFTDDNILTIGPNAITGLNSTHYVVGNLQMTVTNINKVTYHVGTTGYTPVSMKYASPGTTQQIIVNSNQVDPTANRGGNPDNSINVVWDIQPQGEPVRDSLLVEFGFPTSDILGSSLTPQLGQTFAAKWDNGSWADYRNTIATLSGTVQPYTLTGILNGYAVRNSDMLTGIWAVFVSNQNTEQSKNDAIRTDNNRIVIKDIPAPVTTGIAFRITLGLEDKFGQPTTSSVDLPIEILFGNPTGIAFVGSPIQATFPAGASEQTIQLQVGNNGTSPLAQLEVRATGDSAIRWTPALSDYFAVIPTAPSTQANNITFSRITYTGAKATWKNGDGENVLIVAKADNLLESNEYPLNGQTYTPNQVYGSGANIGNAVVLYNGTSTGADIEQSMDIAGLLPNTNYYVYAFAYNGDKGEESYKITASTLNPNMLSTLEGDDDDVTLGSNNDYEGSATVGTNAPIVGKIYGAGDVDCFNFMVTSAAPNVRVLLTNVAGNYTLELYDFTGRRIRRSTLNGNVDEALVVNNLPAGTFVVKVFAEDGSAWERTGDEYKLLINTFSTEIFSVTPAPNMD